MAIASSVLPAFRSSSARSGSRTIFWLGVLSMPARRAAARCVLRNMFLAGSRSRVICSSRAAIRRVPAPGPAAAVSDAFEGSRPPPHPGRTKARAAAASAAIAARERPGMPAGAGVTGVWSGIMDRHSTKCQGVEGSVAGRFSALKRMAISIRLRPLG